VTCDVLSVLCANPSPPLPFMQFVDSSNLEWDRQPYEFDKVFTPGMFTSIDRVFVRKTHVQVYIYPILTPTPLPTHSSIW